MKKEPAMRLPIYNQLNIPEENRDVAIRWQEAEFLHFFLRDKKIDVSLEVGFAYGCSTAHIMTATGSKHYVIDPYQELDFNNLGLENIKKLNLESNLVLETDFSHNVLPRLLKENVKLDFALIDGGHLFDEIFLDFFYIDLLLNDQGYVVFHDSWMRATQLAASWVRKNRLEYRLITEKDNLIIFQKNGKDHRNWMHFKEFYTLKSMMIYRRYLKYIDQSKAGSRNRNNG